MNHCPTCGNWIVRNAHFCHTCGYALAGVGGHRFEAGYGGYGGNGHLPSGPPPPAPARGQPIKERLSTALTVSMAAGAGVLFADWDASWIAVAPLAYVLFDPVSAALARLLGKVPAPRFERAAKIQVVHHETDPWGKRFVGRYELPEAIEMEHIQWIAEKVLDPPLGEGRPFSRRGVCKAGKFSQGQFYALRDAWLKTNHCFYRDPAAPSCGLILTERCTRLLKKALPTLPVAGG